MNTNSFNIGEAVSDVTSSLFGSVTDGLEGAASAISDNGYSVDILQYLSAILVALLVIWGLWFVVRRLMRAMRSTR